VDCLLAEIKIRSYGDDRLSSLREASDLLENFLMRLDQYSLLSKRDRELYTRYLEERNAFRLAATNNAEEKRKIKITRFQEEKSLKQKLEVRNENFVLQPVWLTDYDSI
jgi:immunoglobulin-binding protein 1